MATNTAIGGVVMNGLTTGASNTAMGRMALQALTVGQDNVVIVYDSMSAANVGESENIVLGSGAMSDFEEGTGGGDIDCNVVIGHEAFIGGDLLSNDRQVTDNIAIGRNALNSTSSSVQIGTKAIGFQALTALNTY